MLKPVSFRALYYPIGEWYGSLDTHTAYRRISEESGLMNMPILLLDRVKKWEIEKKE